MVGCPPVVAPHSRRRCALPPSGFGGKYTPRCLRKGGASAFAAEGGSTGAICYLVDLAVNAPVPEMHNIDVLASPFTKLFFGFRVRH